ncbi:hypothetical protein Trydic_g7975 [Trypoxylus dichotomus]
MVEDPKYDRSHHNFYETKNFFIKRLSENFLRERKAGAITFNHSLTQQAFPSQYLNIISRSIDRIERIRRSPQEGQAISAKFYDRKNYTNPTCKN